MLEEHVKDEVKRLVDIYVDAYKRHADLSIRVESLQQEIDARSVEIETCMAEMESSESAINSLLENVEDESSINQVSQIIGEAMGKIAVIPEVQ